MNLEKIGKFIASQRKENNLTQSQVAEKLGITDRAISKWENGNGLPDASIMLDLCNLLNITVNELLSGTKLNMDDYKKKAEEHLVEMKKNGERMNRRLLYCATSFMIVCLIFYFTTLIITGFLIPEGTLQGIIIALSTIIFFVAVFLALKFEKDAGYYECKYCHHKFVPSYKEALFAMHICTTRYLKCPKCGNKSWSKKVFTK